MKKDEYLFPLPKDKLVARFRNPFKKLIAGYSATVVTLPHTGRTSHLRTITSNNSLLTELGITNEAIVFVDFDKSITNYASFLSETINTLCKTTNTSPSGELQNAISSQDSYLLATSLIDLTTTLTKTYKIILVISVKKKTLHFFQDIDNIIVQMQKATTLNPLPILWSIDSYVLRNFKPGHPSSSITHNLFFQKTFDAEESIHSLTRSAMSKAKNIPQSVLQHALKMTGGIAAFSHQITNVYKEDLSFDELISFALETSYSKAVLETLVKEAHFDQEIFNSITTAHAREFVSKTKKTISAGYKDITFSKEPTSQDLLLLIVFKTHFDKPVSRDVLASGLWGKNWQKQYSDWALDKALSRLRKKIQKPHKIITIKNFGYQLIKL